MSAFGAMLVDSYRELNSRKLFWIILGLSGIVVLYFASIGFNETGMSMFFGLVDIENPLLSRDSALAVMLYRSIFSSFIVGIWLAWIATILALISTSTIFPDFIAGGAIDLVLSKPIGRVRLFFMKYAASLLFVLLQVGLFCVGIFLSLGFRLGDWEWKIFLAIPLVTVFFSYLFSICVLFGVLTRSAMAALLVTLLFWVSLFGLSLSEGIVNQFKTGMIVQVEERDEQIAGFETSRERIADTEGEPAVQARARLDDQIKTTRSEREETQELIGKLERWHRPIRGLQTVLPKTAETIALLDRWLKKDTDVDLMDILSGNVHSDGAGGFTTTDASRDREVRRRMDEEIRGRSTWYVTGTSLAFEAVILGLACFVFARRDY